MIYIYDTFPNKVFFGQCLGFCEFRSASRHEIRQRLIISIFSLILACASLSQYTKVPTALQALMDDPELVKTTELSKNLWGTCNPGYMLRDPKKMKR